MPITLAPLVARLKASNRSRPGIIVVAGAGISTSTGILVGLKQLVCLSLW